MKFNKSFYVIPWGSSLFADDSDSAKEYLRNIFKGFDTEEEAREYAKTYNDEFKKEHSSEEDYYDDLTSKEAIVVERDEVSEYLEQNFDYLS